MCSPCAPESGAPGSASPAGESSASTPPTPGCSAPASHSLRQDPGPRTRYAKSQNTAPGSKSARTAHPPRQRPPARSLSAHRVPSCMPALSRPGRIQRACPPMRAQGHRPYIHLHLLARGVPLRHLPGRELELAPGPWRPTGPGPPDQATPLRSIRFAARFGRYLVLWPTHSARGHLSPQKNSPEPTSRGVLNSRSSAWATCSTHGSECSGTRGANRDSAARCTRLSGPRPDAPESCPGAGSCLLP